MEAVKTNINGAMNIVDAALDCGVKRVVALSTDKAVNPSTSMADTKLVSDKLFIAAEANAEPKMSAFHRALRQCGRKPRIGYSVLP